MKKLVKTPVTVEKIVEKVTEEREEIVEEEGGYLTLLGKRCLVMSNYIYHGVITGVNHKVLEMTNPSIIYETGDWMSGDFKDKQKLCTKKLLINVEAIETAFEVEK